MRYLLDTNAVIALLSGKPPRLSMRARQLRPNEIGMSSIVAHELYYGAFKSQLVERNLTVVDALQFEVVEFDKEDARQAGELRAALAAQGQPIGPYDVLIAGQAMARGLVLVTHNTREFGRVRGVSVEDWQV